MGVLGLLHVLDHARYQAGVDDCLDGWAFDNREDLAHSDHAVVLFHDVGVVDGGDEVGEDVHCVGRAKEAELL